jgi:putative ABC transport system permease protein
MTFLFETLRLGLANLRLHKLRSLLTALGIIIGVAAVVAIAAYGEGAKQAALQDILQLGATNIIVRSQRPPEPEELGEGSDRTLQYGLLRSELRAIEALVRPVDQIVPLKRVGSSIYRGRLSAPAEVYGTTPGALRAMGLTLYRGRYLTDQDMARRAPVAVLGAGVADRLFPLTDPLGQTLQVDDQTFVVVGLLRPVGLAGGAGATLVGRDLNLDVHVPIATARALFSDLTIRRRGGVEEREVVELSELIIEAPEQDAVMPVAAQVQRLLEAEHAEDQDVNVIVPLELLHQAERTQLLFSVLMIIIAGLSLLVGGIGIMNIMLASVTERTREIGIRRALGATRKHIIAQFLVETTVLSALGGLIGVALGIASAAAVALAARVFDALEPPVVTATPTLVAFVVATTVGIAFGLYPAIKAAQQDPIVALRHD